MVAAALQQSNNAGIPLSLVHTEHPSQFSDAELIEMVVLGSGEAVSELYGRYCQLLKALALRIVRNIHDAEEVLQEVFIYVWKKAVGYDSGRSSVSSWLAVITRSRSLDRLRQRQRIGDWEEIPGDEPAPMDRFAGFGQVLNRERGDRLREALGRLPESQREVLELAFFKGWTQKEVAEKTGIPIGTVKTRTFLAIRKLRRELTAEADQLM